MEKPSSPSFPHLVQDSPNNEKAVTPTQLSPSQSSHIDGVCLKCKHLEAKVSRLETEVLIHQSLDQYQTSEIKRLRTVIQRHERAIWNRVLVYLRLIQDAVYNANRVFEQFGLNISQNDLQKLVGHEGEAWTKDQDEEKEWFTSHTTPGAWPTETPDIP
jgi:hypothetical protein